MEAESSPRLPVTTTTLLHGLRDSGNATVWRQYVDRFRPAIVRYARKLSVPEDQVEDIAQSTLLEFSQAYRSGRYERDRGRLSSWLFGFARNQIRDWSRRRKELARGGGDDTRLVELPAEDELVELWEREWRDSILWECLQLIRGEVQRQTMRAFELFALEDRPAEEVAQLLEITPNAVFGAKRRVLSRIKEIMPLVEDAW